MKYLLSSLFIIIVGVIIYGFFIKNSEHAAGEKIIGIGVLAIAFIFMPLFIYHRYKNKNIKDFTFDKYRKDLEDHVKKENQ